MKPKFFADGSVFNNAGTVTWLGGGTIQAHGNYNTNFIFNNKSGGRFEVAADGEIFSRASGREGTPTFNNEAGALVIKTAGEAFSELTVFKFNNYGQMNAQAGGFQFKTNVLFSDAAPLIGAGRFYEMQSGRFDIIGALNVGNTTMTLFGTDIVANGPITLEAPAAGRLRLQDGRYFGTFAVPNGSFVEFSDAPGLVRPKFFGDGSVFNNEGTVTWLGGGTIQAEGNGFAANPVFNNKSGGVFEIAGEGPVFSRASFRAGTPVFNNASGALVHKTAPGDALINTFNFDNAGALLSDDGTLSFNTGAWAHDGTTYSGAGGYRMTGGALYTDGTITFGSAFSVLAGEVFGPGTGFTSFATTSTGLLHWGGGRFSGRFALTENSRMLIDDGESATATEKDLSDGSVFDNFGLIGWTGAGAIQAGGYGFAPNPIFNNQPGATFTAAPSGGVFNRESYRDGTPLFNNAGVLNIGTSPGITKFEGWNFAQTATGKLNIEVGGADPLTPDFDQLKIDRHATLDGILNVTLLNGYIIPPATSLTPITFASRTAQFGDVHALGSIIDLTYSNTSVTLVAKAQPEDNKEWKQYFFGDPASPDAQPLADPDGDGIPNLQEYAFGGNPLSGSGSGISAQAVDSGMNAESDSVTAGGVRYGSVSFSRPTPNGSPLPDVSYLTERAGAILNPQWSFGDVVEHSRTPNPRGRLRDGNHALNASH